MFTFTYKLILFLAEHKFNAHIKMSIFEAVDVLLLVNSLKQKNIKN